MDKRLVAAILFSLFAYTWTQFEDEMQKYEQNCLAENAFRCADNTCISQYSVCDGMMDCPDQSDEENCAAVNETVIYECNDQFQFTCKDGSGCVHLNSICDGVADCKDKSDTQNCSSLVQIVDHYYYGKKGPAKTELDCSLFPCDGGTKCISYLWLCDGHHDCEDKTDETDSRLCKIVKRGRNDTFLDGKNCLTNAFSDVRHQCNDHSFCLRAEWMCDGVIDCKDGSDERPEHCANWTSMCKDHKCGPNSTCIASAKGSYCKCVENYKYYDNQTNTCVNRNECLDVHPVCSQKCTDYPDSGYRCECEEGYLTDFSKYQCFATGDAGLLFFATRNEIKYYNIRTKNAVLAVPNTKQAHGVAFDGKYIYWLETLEGHQAIYKAELNNINKTKMTLVAVGLEDPGDIALDWIGEHLYFTDAARGHIVACLLDGSMCAVLNITAKYPKYLALHPQVGEMYWADWHGQPMIMHSKMDGSNARIFMDDLKNNPTGLTLDIPNERLYYVDQHIYVAKLSGGRSYLLLEEEQSRPFSLAVFENTVYWSSWGTNALQASDKIRPPPERRRILLQLSAPVHGIHIYHPVLRRVYKNPCDHHHCSDLCLLTGNGTSVCACHEGRQLVDKNTCTPSIKGDQYLIVGGGNKFTRFRYNSLGNLESTATTFNIGRVQAMAFDNHKQILYIYDGERKTINYISLNDFSRGITQILEHRKLVNIVDMDYEYISDSLYILDATRGTIDVISLKTKARVKIYTFNPGEVPISLCVMPDYGRLMVALIERDKHNEVHIDIMGLNGKERKHAVEAGFRGPHIRVRYSHYTDKVFISDEAGGIIDYIHPTGTGKEEFRIVSTTVRNLAVTDYYVFWTDRRTPRLFWTNIHETQPRVHRIEMNQFANHSQLYIQATVAPPDLDNPLMQNPCFSHFPCTHICVQVPHQTTQEVAMDGYMGYNCLCPVGLALYKKKCEPRPDCNFGELYCSQDNTCVKGVRCDGVSQCSSGEDEVSCELFDTFLPGINQKCEANQKLCEGHCAHVYSICPTTIKNRTVLKRECSVEEFACEGVPGCLPRWMQCNQAKDCPDGSDEAQCDEFQCLDFEFKCASGSCILSNWRCDGDEDCKDGSDEINCVNKSCPQGFYQCGMGPCVEISKRCNGVPDCLDASDEEDCDEETLPDIDFNEKGCEENELKCRFNTSICLPLSARCNSRVDCPDGSDEADCHEGCSHDMFKCPLELTCIPRKKMCDGTKDCSDGSDEVTNLCRDRRRVGLRRPGGQRPPAGHVPDIDTTASKVHVDRITIPDSESRKRPPAGHILDPVSHPESTTEPRRPAEECIDSYQCDNGDCLEFYYVCDKKPHCVDGSDEGPTCESSCDKLNCRNGYCQQTPLGGVCMCNKGFRWNNTTDSCEDIDECAEDYCSQHCVNSNGTFFCFCFTSDFTLRKDRRTCKVSRGRMSIVFLTGNSVRSVSSDGTTTVLFNDPSTAAFTDMDYNVRLKRIYLTSKADKKLLQVNLEQPATTPVEVTNIGEPAKVAVDWIGENVYFVDTSPDDPRLRVCNVDQKRCTKLQRFPKNTVVTALVLDPSNNKMFYCLSTTTEAIIWTASLNGNNAVDLISVSNCTGLAVDMFRKLLYVAETEPSHILQINYAGEIKKVIKDYQKIKSPHDLALFDEEIYFLVANTFELAKCNVRREHCSSYLYRIFDARSFAVNHESVQRNDVVNNCTDGKCSHVCIQIDDGMQCVCENGDLSSILTGADCGELESAELPLFNGYTRQYKENVRSIVITITIMVAMLAVVTLILYLWYRCRTPNFEGPSVLFRTGGNRNEPAVEIEPENADPPTREYVNPVEQYIRNVWRRSGARYRTSFRHRYPTGTATLQEAQSCVSTPTGSTSSGGHSRGSLTRTANK